MVDISNKLHAMVDEFVSNLSSECDSLANNVSAQALLYGARDRAPEAALAPRPSNRTATDILNGLRRPSGSSAMDTIPGEGQSPQPRAKVNLKEGTRGRRDGGNSLQSYELLSSDHSSDDYRRPAPKSHKKLPGNQRGRRMRNPRQRGSSPRIGVESPVRSPESSHNLDYSYEVDTPSVGGKSLDVQETFEKLRWPQDIEDLLEVAETEKAAHDNVAIRNTQSHKRNARVKCNDDIILPEGDESAEDEIHRLQSGAESDDEELPVLPKVPVKRRLRNEPGPSQRRTERGKKNYKSSYQEDQNTPD